MLDGLKRLLSSGSAPAAQDGWEGIAPWAAAKGYSVRGVGAEEGFVIDGRCGATPWRLEWGPSQRPYIEGQELRIRAELGLASDLQLVVMDRTLQEAMEKAVFEQYVEGVQTRIDEETPPEMRWLVMFPKLADSDMPALRERFVALSSIRGWLLHWLEGPLSQALAGVRLAPGVPFVLMIGRGRLTLRTALADAQVGSVQGWLRLFEVAMREALRVVSENADALAPSTQGSLWSASVLPPEGGEPPPR